MPAIEVLGETACVPLTRGQTALIDTDDLDVVSGRFWSATWQRTTRSYCAKTSIRRPDGHRTSQSMSRMIVNAQRGQYVDHINHDTLDNRRSNLRVATCIENGRNQRGAHQGSTSNLTPTCLSCNTGRGTARRHRTLVAAGWWAGHDTIARLGTRRNPDRFGDEPATQPGLF